MGWYQVSTEQLVREWTTRQAKVVNLATKVNAKASTTLGTEKVSAGKKFRFGGSKVDTGEVAFA